MPSLNKREEYLNEMQTILQTCKQEKRSFDDAENKRFETLEKQVNNIDKEFEKHGTNLQELMDQMDDRERRHQESIEQSKKKVEFVVDGKKHKFPIYLF